MRFLWGPGFPSEQSSSLVGVSSAHQSPAGSSHHWRRPEPAEPGTLQHPGRLRARPWAAGSGRLLSRCCWSMSGFICAVLDSAGFLTGADACCAGNFQLFAQRALTSVPRGSRGRDWERRQRSDFQAGTFSALTPGPMTWRGGALPAGPQPAAPRTGRWRRSP